MTPRPVIRWKSFWFGILVLVFLAFGWVRSMTCLYSVSYGYGGSGDYCGIYLLEGKLTVGRSIALGEIHGFDVMSVPMRSGHWWSVPMKGGHWWPAAVRLGRETKGPVNGNVDEEDLELEGLGEWWLNLAFWFLILLFLVPWSAFLAWRWRRQRILTKAHDAAPAH